MVPLPATGICLGRVLRAGECKEPASPQPVPQQRAYRATDTRAVRNGRRSVPDDQALAQHADCGGRWSDWGRS